ncbi:MAG: hypothetical protein NVS2B7_25330 [Herpetosiphon sp.]
MAVEDFLESEVAVAVAATAAVLSPRVRGVVRKGLVYGMAGVLMAGDTLTTFARSVSRGAREAAGATAATAQHAFQQAEGIADRADHSVAATTEPAVTSAEKRSRRGAGNV